MEIGRRRQTLEAPPPDDPGDPRLLALLREEIDERGPITFARFMQRALYEPGLGYYTASTGRPTRGGDYLTAPELHPIFGETLARQLHEMWQRLGQPAEFSLVEYGAGRGSLAVAVAEGLAGLRSGLLEALRYEARDLPRQRAEAQERLADAGFSGMLRPPAARAEKEGAATGCVLANEFLDALPVHRVVRHQGQLLELYVTWHDGRLLEQPGELSTTALARWFDDAGVELIEGQRAEVNVAMLDWLASVASELQRGYVLALDYGAQPAELYGPFRQAGTLRAFRGQHVSREALRGVGRQDLTAHVDLGALRRGAERAGFDVLGQTTQAHFLLGCGLEEALAERRARQHESWEGQLLLRAAVARLLDPRALGGYAVVILGRGVSNEPPLRGLSFQLPARA